MAANSSGGGGNPNVQVGVQINPQLNGMGRLKAQWADFAGDLLEPVAILAAGGTKVQAAWAGMRGVFLTRVLGPLGMVTGAAAGFLLVTRKLIAEWRTLGLRSAKQIETLTLQFKPLLGSMDLAKKRAREVFAFSVKTPFQFPELAEGNKILEGLTRGALSGKAGMELVGDAAAVAGTDFADTARQVGRLYDGLMSGRPVGEAAFRLQELGLISGQTRTQIEAMQAANAAGSAVWEVARRDLERAKGAMVTLSESLEGLESTYADTRTALQAGFGAGFMEGEKEAVKSATQVMERMVPTAQKLGDMIGVVSNFMAKVKARAVDAATGNEFFSKVMTGAALAVTGFSAAILLAAGAHLGKFLVGIRGVAAAQVALAQTTVAATAAQTVMGAVTVHLRSAYAALQAALKGVAAGNVIATVTNLKLAAAETIVAFRTNAVAAAQVVLRGALLLTKVALLTVVSALRAVAVAMVATPIGLAATAFTALGTAALYFYTQARKAREEMRELANAARATVVNLQQQALAIRTVADLRKAEADAVTKLADAYARLYAARADGDAVREKIALREIAGVKEVLAEVRGKDGKTELSEEDVGREDARKERDKEAKREREDDAAGRGEQSAVEVARQRVGEGTAKADAARLAEAEEERVRKEQEARRRKVDDGAAEEGALLAESERLVKAKNERSGADPASAAGRERAAMEAALAVVKQRLEAIRELRAAEAARISQVALESKSEVARLNEQLRIFEELKNAQKGELDAGEGYSSAQAAYDEANQGMMPDTEKEHQAVQAAMDERAEAAKRLKAAEEAARGAGVADWQDRDRQNADRRVQEVKREREADLDPVAREEEKRALRDAEVALAQGRVDDEARIAELRLKGYEREKAMVDFEREKLEIAYRKGKLDEDAYKRQVALLDAQQAAMEREAADKRAELQGALQTSSLRRREESARREGRQQEAEALLKRADAVDDAATRRDAVAEAEALPEGERGAYVEDRVTEAQRAREDERRRGEQARGQARSGSMAEQGSAAAEVEARAEELRGRSKAARRIREEAAREQDEVARRDAKKRYREEGFEGPEADAMANRDVKLAQAQRMMEQMQGGGGIVASSLAKIGGGGNVAGTDPNTKYYERMVRLLEEIRNNSKEGVSMEMEE